MTDALKAASTVSIGILFVVMTRVQADDLKQLDKGTREPTTMRVYWKEEHEHSTEPGDQGLSAGYYRQDRTRSNQVDA